MKRRWARALSLTVLFCMPVVASAFRTIGIIDLQVANKLNIENQNLISMKLYEVFGTFIDSDNYTGSDSAEKAFSSLMKSELPLKYNFVFTDANGKILHKMNDSFLAGDTLTLLLSNEEVKIIDTEAANTLSMDKTDENGKPTGYFFFLSDDNTQNYMEGNFYPQLSTRSRTMNALAIATISFFWFGLAAWVLLDARRLGQKYWLWAALLLASNFIGFAFYIVARSQGFSPLHACEACRKPLERNWVKCPYCGEGQGAPIWR